MDYQEAKSKLWEKVNRNTRLWHWRDDIVTLELHHNPIIEWFPDGRIKLDSCGFKTATTKKRMNQFAHRFSISQRKGKWYCFCCASAEEVEFYDGMFIKDGEHVDEHGYKYGTTVSWTID